MRASCGKERGFPPPAAASASANAASPVEYLRQDESASRQGCGQSGEDQPQSGLRHVELQRLDLLEHASAFQRVDHLGVNRLVQIKDRNRLLAHAGAAKGKVGDVDVVLAHGHAQQTDDARNVLVGGVQHMRADFGIDVDALDLY